MTWEATQRRSQAVNTVHDVVSAMRAIAAGRIQGAQRALESARQYHEVIMRAMATLVVEATARAPVPDGRGTTLLVMTSEQPLCGSFNPQVLEFAERRWRELCQAGEARLLVVGQRGIRQLIARGIAVQSGEPAATSLEGLHDLVKRLADRLGERHRDGDLGTLRVIFNRYQSLSEQVPTEVQVLPLDLARIRQSAPMRTGRFHRYLSPNELLAGLVREYVFISLYLLAAESYASEQASRLVAMDNSTRNTERMLETLHDLERRERQGEVTRDVLELIGARFAAGSQDQSTDNPQS
jgi:F-type H+-transporting ATPase subunit gamma